MSYSFVRGNAIVGGNAIVRDHAALYGHCRVDDSAEVRRTTVSGSAFVGGNAIVRDSDVVCDHAMVYEDAEVFVCSSVVGHAKVRGRARVFRSSIGGNVVVCDNADVRCVSVNGDAQVTGSVLISG